jgi:hypothetical protein
MDYLHQSRERWAPVEDSRLVQFTGATVTWQPWATDDTMPQGWHERFTPDFSPMQMMRMGIFGDAYFGDALGAVRRAMLPQNKPFTRGDKFFVNTRGAQCRQLNYFGKPASLTRQWWMDKHLIAIYDPLGWFEWYCWYWLGRRIARYDDWQVQRWLDFKARHLAQFYTTRAPGSAQALLHWAIRTGVEF